MGFEKNLSKTGLDRFQNIEQWLDTVALRQQYGMTASGALIETGHPTLYASFTAPTSQTIYGQLMGLRAGDVVTGIALRNSVAAAGTLPTTGRFGIANAAGTILAISGNVNSLAAWAVGVVPGPLAAPYTVLADGGYYACFIVNGTWSVTQPTPARAAGTPGPLAALGTGAPPSFAWTGQTDLPVVGSPLTLSASSIGYYAAFY